MTTNAARLRLGLSPVAGWLSFAMTRLTAAPRRSDTEL